MKTLMLAFIVTASVLCGGCGSSCGGGGCSGASYSCCGADNYTGNWY